MAHFEYAHDRTNSSQIAWLRTLVPSCIRSLHSMLQCQRIYYEVVSWHERFQTGKSTPCVQVAPTKFMIFVCDCILELMNAALAKQSADSADKADTSEQYGVGIDFNEGKFDKWVDSPRSHQR